VVKGKAERRKGGGEQGTKGELGEGGKLEKGLG